MKLAPMRFMGYTWHHNPRKIEVVNGKKIVELSALFASDVVECFGEKPLKIRGVGELYGSDCMFQYERLCSLYKKGEQGILCLPSLTPVYACFDTLKLLADDKKDVLTYEFGFTNVYPTNSDLVIRKTVNANKGDTLFDISARYNVPIETLISLNKDIMFINDLEENKQVNIC